MFGRYLDGPRYDLKGSYVIGDRLTDVELARNLGASGDPVAPETEQGRRMAEQSGLSDVLRADYRRLGPDMAVPARRRAHGRRSSDAKRGKPTSRSASTWTAERPSQDRHRAQVLRPHARPDRASRRHHRSTCTVRGDLQVDEHHTIEDTAIALGEAMPPSARIEARHRAATAYCLPMDECRRRRCCIDFGGRIELDLERPLLSPSTGRRRADRNVPPLLQEPRRRGPLQPARRRPKARTSTTRSKAIFKAFARALRMAASRNSFKPNCPAAKAYCQSRAADDKTNGNDL